MVVGQLAQRRVLLTGLLTLLVGTVLVVRLTDSPEERAQASEPPPPVVTAEVERRELRDVLVLNGFVTSTDTVTVDVPAPTGESAVARRIVTTAGPAVGEEVTHGRLLVGVSAQPVFLLQGEVPFYRDIHPGDSGPDVEVLQNGLSQAGVYAGPVDGEYGADVKAAVARLWETNGFELVVDEEVEGELDLARDALEELEAAAAAGEGLLGLEDLEGEIERVEDQVDDLEARSGPIVPHTAFVVAPVVPAVVTSSNAPLGAELDGGGGPSGVGPDGEAGAGDPEGGESGGGSGALLELSASPPVVQAEATAAQAANLVEGLEASVELGDGSGQELTLPISSVGGVGEAGLAALHVTPEEPFDLELLGVPVQVEVELASSEGEVLAVPVSALRSSPDGGEHVVRLGSSGADGAEGDREVVEVETAEVIGGWVELVTAEPELSPGDRVVVGG